MKALRGTDKKGRRPVPNQIPDLTARIHSVFAAWSPHLLHYGVLAASVLLIYLLIRPPAVEDLSKFRLDQPSPKAVMAPFDFEYVDKLTTEARKSEAEALVSPVYTQAPENLQKTLQNIRNVFEAARATVWDASMTAADWAAAVQAQAGVTLQDRGYEIPAGSPEGTPRTAAESLRFYAQNETLPSSILSHIQTASGRLGIADDVTPLRRETAANGSGPRVAPGVNLVAPDGTERMATALYEIHTYPEFLQRFEELMATSYPDAEKSAAARELARDLVKAAYAGPTLIYNEKLTETRRREASRHIDPIVVQVSKGEILIGKNEPVRRDHIQRLQALQERMRVSPLAETGYLILAVLFVALVLKYLKSYYPEIAREDKKIAVLFLAILMLLAISRIVAYVSLMDLGTNIVRQVGYAIPMGALGVVLTILSSARLAIFCCAMTAMYMEIILRGYIGPSSFPYLLVAVITSFGSIYTVTRIRRRSDLYRAGGVAIFLAMLVILAVSLQQYNNLSELLQRAEELRWSLIWGAVNGALVSILSIALMPIFEDFYGVTTDIKLLEMSQRNELLQRLEQEAPGSYQHSMRVSTLAESAAEAVGANALLTRVGTLYHDIGKMVKPLYFVENQQTSADKAKHSKISPNMSCLIIRNHVKHGLELAEKYKLPKVISDFIPEHHGTTLMTYFYHQALASQETEGTVKEEDFRYPGPKPQSKETAILMLADALEASSRVLENPTERDVRQLVRKIINERFMDGQFDECNLTLKDLHTLYQSFSESIIHMLHQRIAYPTLPPKDRSEDGARVPEFSLTEPTIPAAAIKEREKREPDHRPARIKENGATKENGAPAVIPPPAPPINREEEAERVEIDRPL